MKDILCPDDMSNAAYLHGWRLARVQQNARGFRVFFVCCVGVCVLGVRACVDGFGAMNAKCVIFDRVPKLKQSSFYRCTVPGCWLLFASGCCRWARRGGGASMRMRPRRRRRRRKDWNCQMFGVRARARVCGFHQTIAIRVDVARGAVG